MDSHLIVRPMNLYTASTWNFYAFTNSNLIVLSPIVGPVPPPLGRFSDSVFYQILFPYSLL